MAEEAHSGRPDAVTGGRIGRYEVRGVLGTGAMGQVYRAWDPALAREVAIKALVHGWEADASEERRRFEREARLLATLHHPNIAAIHGWELVDGAPYLVLELVEGETLARRLRAGALRVPQAVAIAQQIISALEEAHGKGVVHRDLKPANIALDGAGRVKVLDFGIAKVLAKPADGAADPLVATTGSGGAPGTAPYMSPEQVRGEAVDTRTDVWAFGCVLYEMLTGNRAFGGSSPAEVTASVLRDDVDWTALPGDTPASVRRLLRRCLRREVHDRLQAIGDARLELAETGEAAAVGPGRGRTSLLPWALAGGLAAAVAVLAVRSQAPRPRLGVVRLSLELPAGEALASDYATPFAVSPDGSRYALLALREGVAHLLVRRVDAVGAEELPGTEGAWQPSFSPDGRSLVFFADRKLKRVSIDGGPVAVLAEVSANPRGASWAPDGSIVYASQHSSGLLRLPAGGETPAVLTRLDLAAGENSHRWPQVLPGGQWVIFTCGIDGVSFDDANVDAVSLATGERRRLWSGGGQARYAAGYLFFARAGRLFAVPLELPSLVLRGAPQVVLDGLRGDARNGGADYALAQNGTLLYVPAAPTSAETHVTWVDLSGHLTRITNTPRPYSDLHLSPDGRRVALRIGSDTASDLWILNTETAALTRGSYGLAPHHPVWTPDGLSVTVSARQDGRWRLLTLTPGTNAPPTVVYESPNRMYPNAWSPDGRSLLFQERREATGWDVRVLDADEQGRARGEPRDVAATTFQELGSSYSRDGRFIAFESDELDGIFGVYVVRAGGGPRARATEIIARLPRWGAHDDLYCWLPPRARPTRSAVPEGMHRIRWPADGIGPVRTEPLWPDEARARPTLSRLVVATYATYDVDASPRGPRFLMLESGAVPVPPVLERPVVALDWLDELRASFPGS